MVKIPFQMVAAETGDNRACAAIHGGGVENLSTGARR
jgi:hypothetical protein